MELSRPDSDKLVACGAIARALVDILDDEYVAGFFRQNLISLLPWCIAKHDKAGGKTARRSTTWRAPSWSWASMDIGVFVVWMTNGSTDSCAQLVGLDYQPTDPFNLYGALKSATMTIKGPVVEVEHYVSDLHVEHRMEPHGAVSLGEAEMDVHFDDEREPRQNLIILLTRIHTTKPDHTFFSPTQRLLCGLVLAPVRNQSLGQIDVYRRVGAFERKDLRPKCGLAVDQGGSDYHEFIRKSKKEICDARERVITIV
jgi:hypothetical protein